MTLTGGSGKNDGRLRGSIKALDPVSGETKAKADLNYPNWSGLLATGGNLVFSGSVDGDFSAYDAKSLKEVWNFGTGCGINAPPVTYTVDGKQYLALLVGSQQKAAVMQDSPELKNSASCSMFYVFSL